MSDETPSVKFMGRFTLANVIQIGMLFIAIVGGYFKFEQRITLTERGIQSVMLQQEAMDKTGTRASQLGIQNDVSMAKATRERLESLENRMGGMAPRVDHIDESITWIKEWMKTRDKP